MDETPIKNRPLNAYILQSPLSQEDKFMWTKGMQNLDEKIAQDILSYLEEFPQDIQWTTEILKRKTEALKNNDNAMWNKILEEERIKLEELAHSEQ